jgi:hypothetical protein
MPEAETVDLADLAIEMGHGLPPVEEQTGLLVGLVTRWEPR